MGTTKEIEVTLRVRYSYTPNCTPLSESLQDNTALSLALDKANFHTIDSGVSLEAIEVVKDNGTILRTEGGRGG